MTTAETAVSGGSSSTARGMRDELSDDAQRLKDTAKNRTAHEADRKKSEAARAGHSASAALDRAADDLDDEGRAPDWVSGAFRQTASSIERFSSDLEGRSPEDMARQVRRFARENPTAFLAASAAAGFAAARLLRAGHHHEEPPRDDRRSSATASSGRDSAFGFDGGEAGAPRHGDASAYPIGGTRP